MQLQSQKVSFPSQRSFLYRVKSSQRFTRAWHCHPEYELTWIVASQGQRIVGDVISNYESGDLVLLGQNLPHMWRSEGDAKNVASGNHRAIVVQFLPTALGVDFKQTPELRPVATLLERAAGGLQIEGATRGDVSRRLKAMRHMSDAERWVELLRILLRLSQGRADLRLICHAERLVSLVSADQRRFDRVFAFLEDRLCEPISQAEVAKLSGLSPAGFSRFFRRVSGKTFVSYVAELRVRNASRLLVETDLSVLEVSLRSGFRNLSNFNRAFRRIEGTTPREYRRHALTAAG